MRKLTKKLLQQTLIDYSSLQEFAKAYPHGIYLNLENIEDVRRVLDFHWIIYLMSSENQIYYNTEITEVKDFWHLPDEIDEAARKLLLHCKESGNLIKSLVFKEDTALWMYGFLQNRALVNGFNDSNPEPLYKKILKFSRQWSIKNFGG